MKAVTKYLSEFDTFDTNDFVGSQGFLFFHSEVELAGYETALKVPGHLIVDELGKIEHVNETDFADVFPTAFGCIPYDSATPHDFVIPRVTIGKTNTGHNWITVIGEAPFLPPKYNHSNNGDFSIRPGVSIADYLHAVIQTRDAVRAGEISKAVIARDVIVECGTPMDIKKIWLQIASTYQSSYRYFIDGLIGASPELLVAVRGNEVTSNPLAGTVPRTGNQDLDKTYAATLVASTKNQLEHRIVIDMVHDTLLPWCSYLDWEPEPSVVSMANVQHLGTRIHGLLSKPLPTVIDLAYALSPTPALGGYPCDLAAKHIAAVEGMDRGRYGGAVGYINSQGDGTFAVTIRCAELNDSLTQARLFAGGGIVGDSDPQTELFETQNKLQAMLSAIVRP